MKILVVKLWAPTAGSGLVGQPGDDQRDSGDEGNDPQGQDAKLQQAQTPGPAQAGRSRVQGVEAVGRMRGDGFAANEVLLGLPRGGRRPCRARLGGGFGPGQDTRSASGRTRSSGRGPLA
jgi:hypothetical protein